ncbi:MAG: hypothetical protein MUO22_09230 [Sedimentisphaerales bacterium]|nr:hypothetical protein [Sedimentisphaerales bacterium]
MITVLNYKCNKELTNLPISLEILSQSSFFVNEISAIFKIFFKKAKKSAFRAFYGPVWGCKGVLLSKLQQKRVLQNAGGF